MAPLLEHHAKAFLARAGLTVPRGETTGTARGAAAIAAGLGRPVVVKALVPLGRKAKAGAVIVAQNPDEAATAGAALLGRRFNGFVAQEVLVEEHVTARRELLVSLNFDGLSRGPVLLLSSAGGVDVEEAAASQPGSFHRMAPDLADEFADEGELARLWIGLGLEPREGAAAAAATAGLWRTFVVLDARVLEVNPLAVTADGQAVALGAMLDVDDDALWRHPELDGLVTYGGARFGRPPTERERAMLELNLREPSGSIRFLELPGGDLGTLLSGGGCSLYGLDLIIAAAGRPAVYFDATAPSETMLRAVFEATLTLPGLRGLIYGTHIVNLTRVETRLRALMDVLRDRGVDPRVFPVVVRLAGPGEEEARALASSMPGLEYYGDEITIDEAVERFLERCGVAGKSLRS